MLGAVPSSAPGHSVAEGDAGSAAFVIALVHRGETQILESFGVSSETGERMPPDHVFAFPAFTEVLIGTPAGSLAASGRLDLDAPIADELPGLHPDVGRIRLAQLPSHRGGLDNAPPTDSTVPMGGS